MRINWANAVKTMVRIETGGRVMTLTCEPGHPDWERIRGMVAGGSLVIGPFDPSLGASPSLPAVPQLPGAPIA